MKNKDILIITPKTKVSQLLESYPELEVVLIEYAPAFKKLINPELRKTVSGITTLQQAASIGNVKVEELINRLRKEVGQDFLSLETDDGYETGKPAWFSESKITQELDAREMLAAGEHPVNQVISDLQQLSKGDIYKLVAPFLPAPLIDKASSLGYVHWVNKSDDQLFEVYFIRE